MQAEGTVIKGLGKWQVASKIQLLKKQQTLVRESDSLLLTEVAKERQTASSPWVLSQGRIQKDGMIDERYGNATQAVGHPGAETLIPYCS